jgi:FkbM family methyltransferase
MFKKISIPLKYIINHPLTKENKVSGIIRFIKWQLSSRINSGAHIVNWIGGLKLSVTKSMHGATGCIYVGLPEFRDMAFLLHYLKKDSFFIDIGANIGVYTLLASGVNKCNSICIEPIPKTFNYLKKNIELNNLQDKVTCLNIGLSKEKDNLYFTKDKDTVNHVVGKESDNTIKVDVDTLDNIIPENFSAETLIKLDVEGFEYNVLKGGNKFLQNDHLKAIIVELNGSSDRFGFKDAMVDEELVKHGFSKFDYNPFDRNLTKIEQFHSEENTLYIRDSEVESVKLKVKKAPPFQLLNKLI